METCYIYGLVDPRDGNIFYDPFGQKAHVFLTVG